MMDDRVRLRRRHLQLGIRLPDKRPLFGAGRLRKTHDVSLLSNGLPSGGGQPPPQLLPLKQTGSKLAPGRVRPPSGTDQQLRASDFERQSSCLPLPTHDLRHTAASLAIEACAHPEADASTPRSPRRSTDTATSCPAWTRRSPRKWMGSDGRLSSEGIAREAMTHIRWGRILEHAAEIGRVTVKLPSGVAFQGRDRSTHNAPSPRGCCRGTFARGYALTSSEPRRRRR
jgi:hypothetical protein